MRVFFDTNVLISAFVSRGLCRDLFRKTFRKHGILIGEPVLIELKQVLTGKFGVPPEKAAAVEQFLRTQAECCVTAKGDIPGISDPDDATVVACAIAGRADLFVTGDKELLDLSEVEGMPIVSPRELWERLASGT